MPCPQRRIAFAFLGFAAWFAAVSPAKAAEQTALVGILQGSAVLVRQAARYALVEGAALNDGDIVETAAQAFVQIEFKDGAIVDVGESGKFILKPRFDGAKAVAVPRLYVLGGWVKVTPAAAPAGEFALFAPRCELRASAGAVVARLAANSWAVFAERGSARMTARDGQRATVALKPGEFLVLEPGADKPVHASRTSPAFLELPKMFRDVFPARAELFAKRAPPVLKPLGPIDYADVRDWLHAEPALRLPLSAQWRSRAADKAFRSALVANLAAHMEWERVLFPERFLPRKPATLPSAGPASTPASVSP